MKFDENPSRGSRGSLELRGSAQSRYLQREAVQRALPFEYFKPLNAASDFHCITSCGTGSSRLGARLSMSEFVLQNRIWIRL